MSATLKITNGTTSIDLLHSAWGLKNWSPGFPSSKGGGVVSNSPLGEGRRLQFWVRDSIDEAFTLVLSSNDTDEAAHLVSQLASLVNECKEYWKGGTGSPVYFIGSAPWESGTRYALITNIELSGLNNQYAQPFVQVGGGSVSDNVVLSVTRDAWAESPPQSDVCQATYVRGDVHPSSEQTIADKYLSLNPIALWKLNETSGIIAENSSAGGTSFNGVYANADLADKTFVNGEAAAGFDSASFREVNIYTAALDAAFDGDEGTIVLWGWHAADTDWDASSRHFINIQDLGGNQIFIRHDGSSNSVVTYGHYTGGTKRFVQESSNASPISEPVMKWFQLAMTWSVSDKRTIRGYFNGINAGAQDGIGDWTPSNLDPGACRIGAIDAASGWNDGAMAYVAIYDSVLTQEQIRSLGTHSNETVSSEELCFPGAYVANKHTWSSLTHIFRYDNSLASFSSNLLDSDPPYDLFPDPPGDLDAIYFGSEQDDDSGLMGGVFNNLVFDLIQAENTDDISSAYVADWQYWNGGSWVSLVDVDQTSAGAPLYSWTSPGVGAVVFTPDISLSETTVNGVTGYWVRNRINSGAASMTAVPQQQNRHVYTVGWPYVWINGDSVPGDMPSVNRLVLDAVTGGDSSTEPLTTRVFAGLRSDSRGTNFVSHINAADGGHNPWNVWTVLVDAAATYVNDVAGSPCGQTIQILEPAQVSFQDYAEFVTSTPRDFWGKYRVFARIQTVDGSSTPVIRLVLNTSNQFTEGVDVSDTARYGGDLSYVDFGLLDIPGTSTSDADAYNVMKLTLQMQTSDATSSTVIISDIVLVPADELFIEVVRPGASSEYLYSERSLSIDSTLSPRSSIRSLLSVTDFRSTLLGFLEEGEGIVEGWTVRSGGQFTIPEDVSSKLFIFSIDYDTVSERDEFADSLFVSSVNLNRNARYSYLRGNN